MSFRLLARLKSLSSLASTSTTSILLMSAYSFKLDFTSEDAPELVVGFARSLNDMFVGQSLLWRARTAFILLGLLFGYGIYRSFTGGRNGQLQSGNISQTLYLYYGH
jgi:ethanolamine phosphate transferase 2 subunit G